MFKTVQKRITALFLVLVLLLSVAGTAALAEDDIIEDNLLTFEIVDGEAVAIACDPAASGEFVLPDAIGGYPQTAGIKFTLDTKKSFAKGPAYPASTYYKPASINRITIDSINGEPFSRTDTYAVVTNNFCAAGGDTYYAFSAASAQFDTGIPLDEALIDYVVTELHGTIGSKYAAPRGDQTIK